MEKTLTVHIEKCLGCHSCEFLCAVTHSASKDPEAIIFGREKPGYRVFVESYRNAPIPIHCKHCEKAACMLACPTHAIYREEEKGPVLFDMARCIGCRMCVQACPFGVMTMRPDGKTALKCDLCVDRLAEGLEPACVTACPTKATTFEEEVDSTRTKRRRSAAMVIAAQEESIVD